MNASDVARDCRQATSAPPSRVSVSPSTRILPGPQNGSMNTRCFHLARAWTRRHDKGFAWQVDLPPPRCCTCPLPFDLEFAHSILDKKREPNVTSDVPTLVTATLALRSTHPKAAARDVLDLIFTGHGREEIEAAAAHASDDPAGRFAQVLTEALDELMTAAEWAGLVLGAGDESVRAALREAWRAEVGSRFVARFLRNREDEPAASQSRAELHHVLGRGPLL